MIIDSRKRQRFANWPLNARSCEGARRRGGQPPRTNELWPLLVFRTNTVSWTIGTIVRPRDRDGPTVQAITRGSREEAREPWCTGRRARRRSTAPWRWVAAAASIDPGWKRGGGSAAGARISGAQCVQLHRTCSLQPAVYALVRIHLRAHSASALHRSNRPLQGKSRESRILQCW